MDKPECVASLPNPEVLTSSHAVVHNVAAYRALALDFELWSKASPEVVTMYLQHFHHLVTTSKFARFNTLRSFQKLSVVRKLLFALKSQCFSQGVLPDVVGKLPHDPSYR